MILEGKLSSSGIVDYVATLQRFNSWKARLLNSFKNVLSGVTIIGISLPFLVDFGGKRCSPVSFLTLLKRFTISLRRGQRYVVGQTRVSSIDGPSYPA